MPGGRRNAGSRNGSSGKVQFNYNNGNTRSNSRERLYGANGDEKKVEENSGGAGRPLAPKHVPIPAVPVDGQLKFETMSLVICFFATALQMLNLYRTVWWLPHSYNNYTMNFYLMDPYLVIFIATAVSRQFVYTVLDKLMDILLPSDWLQIMQKVTRIILLVIAISILSWSLFQIASRHNSIKIFYLCYPSLSVYFLMFGVRIGPFLDTSLTSLDTKEERKASFLFDKPLHNCSFNPAVIRAEAANFRSDFNRRLKRVLFTSSGSAYVCGVAPILFVPQHLYFDVTWAVQYAILFWLGRISAHFAQAYPLRYCDVLHRTALHLGRWSLVGNRNNHTHVPNWNESVLWPHGSIVKHNKDIYRSEGICTAAEPGNANHFRFYTWFSDPSWLLCLLWGLQFLIVGTQMFILINTSEWYQILSMTILLMLNYYTLFKITRDYLISYKVYRVEQIIQEKCQTVINSNT